MKKGFDEAIEDLQRLKVRQPDEVRQTIDAVIEKLRALQEEIQSDTRPGFKEQREAAIAEYFRTHPAQVITNAPDDKRFSIGEKVEYRWTGEPERRFERGKVCVFTDDGAHITDQTQYEIRRRQWRPKNGEPVLFPMVRSNERLEPEGTFAYAAIWQDGHLCFGDHKISGTGREIPFDLSKQGLPWNQVAP